jgi:hypothetical protein
MGFMSSARADPDSQAARVAVTRMAGSTSQLRVCMVVFICCLYLFFVFRGNRSSAAFSYYPDLSQIPRGCWRLFLSWAINVKSFGARVAMSPSSGFGQYLVELIQTRND